MELEELSSKWNMLSERLERETIIRRNEIDRVMQGKIHSYVRDAFLSAAVGFALFPLAYALGVWRGCEINFLCSVLLAGFVIASPSIYLLWLLSKVSRCEGNLVMQERLMTRYARAVVGNYLFSSVGAPLLIGYMVAVGAPSFSAWGTWGFVAGGLVFSVLIFVALVWYDLDRIRELRRRIRELREFEQE